MLYFLFNHISPLIKAGKTRIVNQEDAIPLAADMEFAQILHHEKLNWFNRWTLLKGLLFNLKKHFLLSFSLYFLAQIISFLSPLVIYHFLEGLKTASAPGSWMIYQLIILALLIGLIGYLSGVLMQNYFYHNLKLHQKLITILNHKIFDQSLSLSHEARQSISVGDVVNYMGSDAESAADLCFVSIELIVNSLSILLSIGMLAYYLGVSSITSILIFILLIPISKRVASQFAKLDDETMSLKDQRLNLMSQILNSIRLIKYFIWENSVYKEVSKIREKEIGARKKIVRAESLSGVIYMAISSLVLLVTLLTHYLRGETLTLPLVFTIVSIFSLLEEPFGNLTNIIARGASGLVGVDRITQYSRLTTNHIDQKVMSTPNIEIKDVSYYYDNKQNSDSKVKALSNICLTVKSGESVAVIGSIGSGKSTLLQVLLRELRPQQGTIEYFDQKGCRTLTGKPKNTVLVSQESYIINSSLEENLLFGGEDFTSSHRENALRKAITLASFESDLNQLPMGYKTEIGERGINLSGGQKQRICLARAALKNPDLILLDDPLSAVDAGTEKALCERLIFGEWKTKTRIMVTHRLEYLPYFDKIILLNQGRIVCSGSYEFLKKESADFNNFCQGSDHLLLGKQNLDIEAKSTNENTQKKQTQNESSGRITIDEEKIDGNIQKDLYFSYLKLLGGGGPKKHWWLMALVSSALLAKAFPLLQRTWLSKIDFIFPKSELWFFIGFGIISALGLLCFYFNDQFWLYRGIKAAILTHDKMLKSVLKSQIRFFDSTPVGRILQRFSRDQEAIDVHMMFTHISAIDCFLQILISLFLILLSIPMMIFCFIPILIFYYSVQNSYRRVAREIKRLESINRSPRYAHFKETLQGLTVLRAYGAQAWYKQTFINKLQTSQKMTYNHFMVNRWFSVRVPLIGGVISSSAALLIVWMIQHNLLSIGIAGLVLTYSMTFWRQLNWGIRIFSDIEARLTSVERLNVYCQLPPEKNNISASIDSENSRVSVLKSVERGDIEFQNVNIRYAPHLPLVLNNFSFKIKSGERVGIIGRTGAGKSTIFQALYRLVDIESGRLLIDGDDINNYDLYSLRKSLAIIPQDPSLFLGTIRSNLDRYNEYTDNEIELVLKKTGLWTWVKSLPHSYNAQVLENGSNFSQGQRQLFCLARALLMKAKLVLLDEATSSVDLETDKMIQSVLDDELKGVTLLIIAHRLETVRNCQKIINLTDEVTVHQCELIELSN